MSAGSGAVLLSLQDGVAPVAAVGGKSASLMKLYSLPGLSHHVPAGFALTVAFFEPWVEQVTRSWTWSAAQSLLTAPRSPGSPAAGAPGEKAAAACASLKEVAGQLPLSTEQREALQRLKRELSQWPMGLAAVRSSAPDEDGTGQSFAGVFETVLGVTVDNLEAAVRGCFVSVFDPRVFVYAGMRKPTFAAVVMEMVDARTAGVAFSANPLNSDLDEMMVDSSWGLGESVVDGSVVADRFLWDKVGGRMIEKTLGGKATERRLRKGGGVETREVEEARRCAWSLPEDKVSELSDLVSKVEQAYGMPMDTEWAHTEQGELKLLQARPITTIHPLDSKMITPPGCPRVLYYDYNVASEATTTSPFTHMDLTMYSDLFMLMSGLPGTKLPQDPRMPFFNGATRQFINFSLVLKFIGPSWFASQADVLDPYLGGLFRSSDLDRQKYRAAKLPPEVTCCSAIQLLRKLTVWAYASYKGKVQADPVGARAEYDALWQKSDADLKGLEARGARGGLQKFLVEVLDAYEPVLAFLMGAIMVVLPIFKELDTQRKSAATAEERDEADALCGGYEGDEIMETNIAMHNLARKLPPQVWSEHQSETGLRDLAERVAANLEGRLSDLPKDFLESWRLFMDRYGYDGSDQMFVSSRRYVDSPEVLLSRLRHSGSEVAEDPAVAQSARIARRRAAMARRQARASEGCLAWCRSRSAKNFSSIMDLWMCLRNTPKLHFARMVAMVRAEVLRAQRRLLADGRLDELGDIFHLELPEVDAALADASYDARAALAGRKAIYERARAARSCPIFIDSRCRILKPDVVTGEPGTLVGAAVSPGKAVGRVRLVASPTEKLEQGEVLATVVTDPAWTPLFVAASAIILQVGGALQHGALCARELGKPAVSGIEVNTQLHTGMLVEVDGDTGIVRIIEEQLVKRPSRHLTSSDLTADLSPC